MKIMSGDLRCTGECQHGLAADGFLTERDQRGNAPRHVHIHARTEADQAEALAGTERVAGLGTADDAAGDQARDLDARRGGAIWEGEAERAPLVVLACLVERGVEELAGTVVDGGNGRGRG